MYVYDDKIVIYYNIKDSKQVSYMDMCDDLEDLENQDEESGPEAADRSENKAARVRIIDNVARHNLKNEKPFNHAN